ncbi:MAG TPA: proline racemase family protein [Gammaproteobacteria bacterium]|nr:proline racemase family protein [Gammaproteobacteria bacterium]
MTRIRKIRTIDAECGGDVSRIVVGGTRPVPGNTVADKMAWIRGHADGLRRLLLSPPHGGADMSVDLLVEPAAVDADIGYVIMESMGYPAYSGSNTLCTAAVLLAGGLVDRQGARRVLRLEAPAGVIAVTAEFDADRLVSASCDNPDSFVLEHDATLSLDSDGEITYSLAYSGVFYVLVRAADLGFRLQPAEEPALIECAQRIVAAFDGRPALAHPLLEAAGRELFVHFMGEAQTAGAGTLRARGATFVQPNVLCHSPTGTGTCARLALLHREGRIGAGQTLETVSLAGTRLRGTVTAPTRIGEFDGIRCTMSGSPRVLGPAELEIDLDDCPVPAKDLEAILE